MKNVWNAEDKAILLRNMDRICTAWPELRHWINAKRKDWILAGLSKQASQIPTEWWEHARKTTGYAESSHFMDNNFTGRKRNLLAVCLQ